MERGCTPPTFGDIFKLFLKSCCLQSQVERYGIIWNVGASLVGWGHLLPRERRSELRREEISQSLTLVASHLPILRHVLANTVKATEFCEHVSTGVGCDVVERGRRRATHSFPSEPQGSGPRPEEAAVAGRVHLWPCVLWACRGRCVPACLLPFHRKENFFL